MRNSRHPVTAAVFIVCLINCVQDAFAAIPDPPYFFDMGEVCEDGYTPVDCDTIYQSHPLVWDYGWVNNSGARNYDIKDPGTSLECFPYWIVHNFIDDDVLRDCVTFEHKISSQFKVEIPPGKYRCVVYLGCVGRYLVHPTHGVIIDRKPLEDLTLAIDEDTYTVEIKSGLRARTMVSKGPGMVTADKCHGGYIRVSFNWEVDPSEESITFHFGSDNDNVNSYPSIQAIQIFPREAPYKRLPLYYDNDKKELKYYKSWMPLEILRFINAFNAHQNSEELGDEINGIQDEFVKACAMLWAVGWLDGLEGDWDVTLLSDAIGILETQSAGGNYMATELLEDAGNFFLATAHMTSRGYDKRVYSDHNLFGDQGKNHSAIMDNLGAAEQLFYQIQGDMLDYPYDNDYIETSPLYARSQFLQARILYSVAMKAVPTSFPDPPNAANLWHGIIKKFGEAGFVDGNTNMDLWHFPRSIDLAVFYHITQHYNSQDTGSIILNWKGEPPDGVEESHVMNSWWWPYFAQVPDHATVPKLEWARHQHLAFRAFRDGIDWWVENRMKEFQDKPGTPDEYTRYELGGGDGDDQEGAGLFLNSERAVLDQAFSDILTPLKGLMYNSLYNCDMVEHEFQCYYMGEGSGKSAGDVEHAAEFTYIPLLSLLPIEEDAGLKTKYNNFIAQTTKNLDTLVGSKDNDIWSFTENPPGELWRYFRSFVFGAYDVALIDDPGSPGNPLDYYDIPLNIRAILPTFLFLDLASLHSYWGTAKDRIIELARAWRFHAMENLYDPNNKPDGKPIGMPPAAIWHDGARYCYGWPEGGSNRWWLTASHSVWSAGYSNLPNSYIEDVYKLLYYAYKYDTANPDRHEYLQPLVEAMQLVHQYRKVYAGPSLSPETDSEKWAAVYLRWFIMNSYFNFRDAIVVEEDNLVWKEYEPNEYYDVSMLDSTFIDKGAPYARYMLQPDSNPKDKEDLNLDLVKAFDWLKYYWVLGTTGVANTDRIALAIQGRADLLNQSITGNGTLSWINPDGDYLEMAILVNHISKDDIRVLIYNFETVDRDLSFRVWDVLEPGEVYDVKLGTDWNNDDIPDYLPIPYLGSFNYSKPGDGFSIDDFPADIGCVRILIIEKQQP